MSSNDRHGRCVLSIAWLIEFHDVLQGRKERVDHAIRQMRALMPGTSAEAKLHEGGTAYWTFVELLK